MPVTHEPWLVVLSLVVAIQGAYVGLSLAAQIGEAAGTRRRVLLAAAAGSLAVAIWAMHFVGMLAVRLPVPVDYLVFPTLLSFLVCVIVVGAAVFAASAAPLRPSRLAAAAVFFGSGIVSMHYIGMTALHASAHLEHDSLFVGASIAIAIAASGLALWLAGSRPWRPPLIASAGALGGAIAGMHYTAMAGLAVFPHAQPVFTAPALSTDLLAIVVAIVAFLISGVFLLTLVPDAGAAVSAAAKSASVGRSDAALSEPAAIAVPPPLAASGEMHPANPDLGYGTFAPMRGMGGPPRRTARHLPVERDGARHFVPVERIAAIHANAHYTYLFDGTNKLFCPLAIGEIESRLDENRFVRVHRSHIVNIECVTELRRAGDNGIIKLATAEPYTVPVSRSRFGFLKSLLGNRAHIPVS